jgi:hypothetical protein
MPSLRPDVGGACEAARLRASLALDEALDDDFDLLLLERHLSRCPVCVEVVGEMRATVSAVRAAPPESHRCDATVAGRDARRLPWANVTVSLMTLAVVGVTLPHASSPSSPAVAPRLAAPPPPRLPIGQRLAAEDFATRGRVDDATTPVES